MYSYFVQVPPATPHHLWPHVRGESSQLHSAYSYTVLEIK